MGCRRSVSESAGVTTSHKNLAANQIAPFRPPMSVEFVSPPFAELEACVTDPARPAAARTRGIFYLRTLGTAEAVEVLERGAMRREPFPLRATCSVSPPVRVPAPRSAPEQGIFTAVSPRAGLRAGPDELPLIRAHPGPRPAGCDRRGVRGCVAVLVLVLCLRARACVCSSYMCADGG